MPLFRWSFFPMFSGVAVRFLFWPTDITAAESWRAVNPQSPDTSELTRKIRDHIIETGGGDKGADFKAYEGWMTKGAALWRVCLVLGKQRRNHSSGRAEEAESLGALRHARQRGRVGAGSISS